MQWRMVSGIAAAAFLAITVMVINFIQQPASAAEMLQRVAETSQGYRGWVHFRTEAKGQQPYSVTHFNAKNGVWAGEDHTPEGLEAKMYVLAEKKEVAYSSRSGEIRIGELSETFASEWKKQLDDQPLTVSAAVARMPGAKVAESKEAGLSRFDVVFPKDDPQKAAAEHRSVYPETAAVWADPETKLVKKAELHIAGTIVTTVYTYGNPTIETIYDLGVPREAKVTDVRPAKDIKTILARLRKRQDAGYGDGVAVLTNTDAADPQYWSMCLFARQGRNWLGCRYLVGARQYHNGSPRAIAVDVPAGWPWPSLEVAVSHLKQARPSEYVVSDGTHTYGGYFNAATGEAERTIQSGGPKDAGQKLVPMVSDMRSKLELDLPTRIWPDLATYGTGSKVEVITDKNRPGQLGLRVDAKVYIRQGVYAQDINIYWLDPTREDMPIESTIQISSPDGKFEFKTLYLEHKQLSDGRWYPSRWRTTTTVTADRKGAAATVVRDMECCLQVFPGKVLEPEWFTNFAERLEPTKR